MSIRPGARQSLPKVNAAFSTDRFPQRKIFSAIILVIMLVVDVLPVGAVSNSSDTPNQPGFQTTSTLTFTAEADALVEEQNPDANAGTANYLDVVKANNRSIESYLRFTVSGVSGTIQNVLLRVYSTTDNTNNGPAVYATDNTWTETGITWNNRPARTSGSADNQGSIPS